MGLGAHPSPKQTPTEDETVHMDNGVLQLSYSTRTGRLLGMRHLALNVTLPLQHSMLWCAFPHYVALAPLFFSLDVLLQLRMVSCTFGPCYVALNCPQHGPAAAARHDALHGAVLF